MYALDKLWLAVIYSGVWYAHWKIYIQQVVQENIYSCTLWFIVITMLDYSFFYTLWCITFVEPCQFKYLVGKELLAYIYFSLVFLAFGRYLYLFGCWCRWVYSLYTIKYVGVWGYGLYKLLSYLYNEEFDPGSGWTLATGLTHASRGAAHRRTGA